MVTHTLKWSQRVSSKKPMSFTTTISMCRRNLQKSSRKCYPTRRQRSRTSSYRWLTEPLASTMSSIKSFLRSMRHMTKRTILLRKAAPSQSSSCMASAERPPGSRTEESPHRKRRVEFIRRIGLTCAAQNRPSVKKITSYTGSLTTVIALEWAYWRGMGALREPATRTR